MIKLLLLITLLECSFIVDGRYININNNDDVILLNINKFERVQVIGDRLLIQEYGLYHCDKDSLEIIVLGNYSPFFEKDSLKLKISDTLFYDNEIFVRQNNKKKSFFKIKKCVHR